MIKAFSSPQVAILDQFMIMTPAVHWENRDFLPVFAHGLHDLNETAPDKPGGRRINAVLQW